MALPASPIIKKFFTNKIESSRAEWGDYLLEIADIFSMFDGEELDRDLLSDRFSAISGRSPYALRDVANFRDEFGAYGTYLGLFHIERRNNLWRIYLSKATKHFLCSTEPDVEAFCRTQMSLFQYPNGAGAVPGAMRIQNNAKNDTIREIQNHIRINPLRIICRAVVVMHSIYGIPLSEVMVPYTTLFMLFNDDSINQSFSPPLDAINNALDSYAVKQAPAWVNAGNNLANFKRNFHIFERTGLFSRVQHAGLSIASSDYDRAYSYIKTISEMAHDFEGFEACYGAADLDARISSVILSPEWGKYYDSLTIPMDMLASLSHDVDIEDTLLAAPPIGTFEPAERAFPDLREFQSNQIRVFSLSGNRTDPFETIIRREKANREHARILTMLAAKLRANDHSPYENVFIDLYTEIEGQTYIFEIKSNNTRNALSQIRKAIAQLYEYRYRSNKVGATLCIVLQQKPVQAWVEDYLLHDRGILLCWLVDDVRLECPEECHPMLSNIGIVE
jgi:hypothetical protein